LQVGKLEGALGLVIVREIAGPVPVCDGDHLAYRPDIDPLLVFALRGHGTAV